MLEEDQCSLRSLSDGGGWVGEDNSMICGIIWFRKKKVPIELRLCLIIIEEMKHFFIVRKINIQPKKRSCLMIRQ